MKAPSPQAAASTQIIDSKQEGCFLSLRAALLLPLSLAPKKVRIVRGLSRRSKTIGVVVLGPKEGSHLGELTDCKKTTGLGTGTPVACAHPALPSTGLGCHGSAPGPQQAEPHETLTQRTQGLLGVVLMALQWGSKARGLWAFASSNWRPVFIRLASQTLRARPRNGWLHGLTLLRGDAVARSPWLSGS